MVDVAPIALGFRRVQVLVWAVLSDEQTSKGWPFSLLDDEQLRNWLGVEHQPVVASASCCLAHLASPGAFASAVVSSANWQIGDASNETKVVNIPPKKKL